MNLAVIGAVSGVTGTGYLDAGGRLGQRGQWGRSVDPRPWAGPRSATR